jgi:hypothetical protein
LATTVITGRDLTLTIATKNYDEQALSATLTNEASIEVYQTLYQKAYKNIDNQWTFEMEMLADWGAADSLCEALWNAAESAPNTTIAVSFTAITGAAFSFNVLPLYPSVGGTSPDAQTVSLSFTVVGDVTESFT